MDVQDYSGFVPPMKARAAAALPRGEGWLFEVKFDGIRAITVKNGLEARLFSRKPRELTGEYPEIVEELKKIPSARAVLDGEIVALEDDGRSSFQLLQNRATDKSIRPRICYYVFDLLHLDGKDLISQPLRQRKRMLRTLLKGKSGKVRISPTLEGDPDDIWKNVLELGLEGIVAKREDSRYEPDRRSGAWLKVKAICEQEYVIGGYTAPKGGRQLFGALLVGYYQDGSLTFAGKVGTGFDEATLKALHARFAPLKTDQCPFERGLEGEFSRPEFARCSWLKPDLVCQIKFAEWTQDGKLRQPVYLGLRTEKEARQVVREIPV